MPSSNRTSRRADLRRRAKLELAGERWLVFALHRDGRGDAGAGGRRCGRLGPLWRAWGGLGDLLRAGDGALDLEAERGKGTAPSARLAVLQVRPACVGRGAGNAE